MGKKPSTDLAVVDKVDGHKRLRLRQWQKKFLEALRLSPNVTAACRSANISREIVYRTRRNDPAFAEMFESALDEAIEQLETKAWDLAMRDNVPLLMFLLRCHKPSVYSRPEQHQHALLGRIVILPEKENRDD